MQRSAFIFQALLLFYLVLGLLMVVAPTKLNYYQKKLAQTFRLISEKKVHQPLHQKRIRLYRIFGVCYVAGCLFILLHMRFQVGIFPEKNIPVWTLKALQKKREAAPLHQIVTEIVEPLAHKHVGLVIATIADDEHDITGFGRINLTSNQPPDGDTIFEIGSISKVFTGIVLADLIARQQLALDSSIPPLLPTLSIKPDSQVHDITLAHLVTHTAGLPRMPTQTFRVSQIWRFITAGDSYRSYTKENILNILSKRKLRHPPGEQYAYSNVGFGLLGLILSEQSGMEYHHLIQTVIADPLGLKDTGVYLNENQRARLAAGYRSYVRLGPVYLAQVAENWEFPNSIAGAGGLRSTANDMCVFLAANMGRRLSRFTQILKNSHRVLFMKNHSQIGMGWLYKKLPQSQETIIWHNGGTGGYASFLGFTENGRLGVIILSNSTKKVDYIGHKILDSLTAEL